MIIKNAYSFKICNLKPGFIILNTEVKTLDFKKKLWGYWIILKVILLLYI